MKFTDRGGHFKINTEVNTAVFDRGMSCAFMASLSIQCRFHYVALHSLHVYIGAVLFCARVGAHVNFRSSINQLISCSHSDPIG